MMRIAWLTVALLVCLPSPSEAQTVRIDIFFENDQVGSDYRDASWGQASGGDFLRLVAGSKMPVETSSAVRGTTSGAIEYRHAGGTWDLFIAAEGWPAFNFTVIDSLFLFVNGPAAIAAEELPHIGLEDVHKTRSGTVALGDYLDGIDGNAATWQRVSIPLTDFQIPLLFSLEEVQTVRFTASPATNPSNRTLWVDDIHAIGDASHLNPPPPPSALETRVGDRSVILHWTPPATDVAGYRVYRSDNGGSFGPVSGLLHRPVFVDVGVENGVVYAYEVRSVDEFNLQSEPSAHVEAVPATMDDAAFIELVHRTAFDYFWREADPTTGHVRDRDRRDAACSIAATGMGLSAVTIGIDRGWITRSEGRERVRLTLDHMWSAPQGSAATGTSGHRGFFYHFVNCSTGLRAGLSELSTIDTALLMAGVLHVGEYFDDDHPDEVVISQLADDLYRRVEWDWAQVRPPRISHGWYPESGFIPYDYAGYDETMVLYLLAIGSPTHPVAVTAWHGYTATYNWQEHYGYEFVVFPPLFGHQYSHLWFDFRGIADVYMRNRGSNYFENSVRATRANRAYAIHNPQGHPNYGPDEWGLTASDIPGGYLARGAPPAMNDEGTLAPTAPGGSFAFTPDESLSALRAMYDRHRERLWGPYGFRDAYNISQDWFATDHLGIDQGPFVIMIENEETGRVWEVFMRNEHAQRGLELAGFRSFDVSAETPAPEVRPILAAFPNPTTGLLLIEFSVPGASGVDVDLVDVLGRHVRTLHSGQLSYGMHRLEVQTAALPAGVYFVRLRTEAGTLTRPIVKH
jgi:hypothetical protein